MVNTSSMFTLVSALVGAGGYVQTNPVAAPAPVPEQVVFDLKRARVDIYLGHNSQAVAGIRAAGRQLRALPGAVPARTFAMLDEAAWLTRHNEYARAEQVLDKALSQIATDDVFLTGAQAHSASTQRAQAPVPAADDAGSATHDLHARHGSNGQG
jgi:hypothetical protein